MTEANFEYAKFNPESDNAKVERTAGMHLRACVFDVEEANGSITRGFADQSNMPTPEKQNVQQGNVAKQTTSELKGSDGQQYKVTELNSNDGKFHNFAVEIWGPEGWEKPGKTQAATAMKDLKFFNRDLSHVKKCEVVNGEGMD